MDKIQLLAFTLMLSWSAWSLFLSAVKNGEKQTHSPLVSIAETLISVVILYFGGFFAVIAWPHIVWFVLSVVGMLALYHGYMKEEEYSFGCSLFAHVIVWLLYLKGGFWYTGFIPFHS
jgi:hydrogenase/urease accessory protein HupE